MQKTTELEKDAVDLVTNCMFALDFLEQITLAIAHQDGRRISVRQFYEDWYAQRKLPEHKSPIVAPVSCPAFLTKLYFRDVRMKLFLAVRTLHNASTSVKGYENKPTLAYFSDFLRGGGGGGGGLSGASSLFGRGAGGSCTGTVSRNGRAGVCWGAEVGVPCSSFTMLPP